MKSWPFVLSGGEDGPPKFLGASGPLWKGPWGPLGGPMGPTGPGFGRSGGRRGRPARSGGTGGLGSLEGADLSCVLIGGSELILVQNFNKF